MEKEKTVAVTVRIPESLLLEVTEMAKTFGVTRNRMLSAILESGKIVADSLDESLEEFFNPSPKKEGANNG